MIIKLVFESHKKPLAFYLVCTKLGKMCNNYVAPKELILCTTLMSPQEKRLGKNIKG